MRSSGPAGRASLEKILFPPELRNLAIRLARDRRLSFNDYVRLAVKEQVKSDLGRIDNWQDDEAKIRRGPVLGR